jgi:hypothetical protein
MLLMGFEIKCREQRLFGNHGIKDIKDKKDYNMERKKKWQLKLNILNLQNLNKIDFLIKYSYY